MSVFISDSAEATERLGEARGRAARAGEVIALSGDLGAGKTQWVRGFARGLGYAGRVHSPTFTLVNEYVGGRLKLYHLDLYRLDTPEQVLAAGLGELLAADGVAVVEWAERLAGLRAARQLQLRVRIEITGDTARKIIYDHLGA